MTENTNEYVYKLSTPEVKLWDGDQFLSVIDGQLRGIYHPLSTYPRLIIFGTQNPVTKAFRQMEKVQAEGIQEIQGGEVEDKDAIWYESHMHLYHRKSGGWRLGTPMLSPDIAQVTSVEVDEDYDVDSDETAIHFHNHGFHPQIVRFYSASDLKGVLVRRNSKIPSSDPRVEGIICPGINFLVFSSSDTPILNKKEIDDILSHEKARTELTEIADDLWRIGKMQTLNLYDAGVLPRVPTEESMFDPKLSEYGVSLAIYTYVQSLALKYNLAVYAAKTGSDRFSRVDELPIDRTLENAQINLMNIVPRITEVAQIGGSSPEDPLVVAFAKESDKDLPIVLRILNPAKMQAISTAVDEAHKKHLEIYGPEFVEPMILETVTNKAILEHAKKIFVLDAVPVNIQCFVQRKRGGNNPFTVGQYIAEHSGKIEDAHRAQLVAFMDRVLDGFEAGYVPDMPEEEFLPKPKSVSSPLLEGNITVDEEGVTLIDSATIYEASTRKTNVIEGMKFGVLQQPGIEVKINVMRSGVIEAMRALGVEIDTDSSRGLLNPQKVREKRIARGEIREPDYEREIDLRGVAQILEEFHTRIGESLYYQAKRLGWEFPSIPTTVTKVEGGIIELGLDKHYGSEYQKIKVYLSDHEVSRRDKDPYIEFWYEDGVTRTYRATFLGIGDERISLSKALDEELDKPEFMSTKIKAQAVRQILSMYADPTEMQIDNLMNKLEIVTPGSS